MPCRACGAIEARPLCSTCLRAIRPASVRRIGGLLVRAAALHAGPARVLVHRVKYAGDPAAVALFGRAMAQLLPDDAAALVPAPRAVLRRVAHGVDPAMALAKAIGAETGLPVIAALRSGWWWQRHSGRGRRRSAPSFVGTAARLPPAAVLVDDVVTTGATLEAANAALGGTIGHAVTATAAGRVADEAIAPGPPLRHRGTAGQSR